MKPLKEKTSITLDPEVIAGIRELAEQSDRNFSQYINLVLKRHLQSQQKRQEQRNEQR